MSILESPPGLGDSLRLVLVVSISLWSDMQGSRPASVHPPPAIGMILRPQIRVKKSRLQAHTDGHPAFLQIFLVKTRLTSE